MSLFDDILCKGINKMMDAEDKLKEKTGIDLMKITEDAIERDEILKKEEPVKWVLKKVTIGTVKGLLGSGLS